MVLTQIVRLLAPGQGLTFSIWKVHKLAFSQCFVLFDLPVSLPKLLENKKHIATRQYWRDGNDWSYLGLSRILILDYSYCLVRWYIIKLAKRNCKQIAESIESSFDEWWNFFLLTYFSSFYCRMAMMKVLAKVNELGKCCKYIAVCRKFISF